MDRRKTAKDSRLTTSSIAVGITVAISTSISITTVISIGIGIAVGSSILSPRLLAWG